MFHQVMDWNVKKQNIQDLTIELTAMQLAKELYFVNDTKVNCKQFYKAKFAYEK